MAKVRFELWNGPIFLLLHMLGAKYKAVLRAYQKQMGKEKREVHFCYHDSRYHHQRHALVPSGGVGTWTRDRENSISKGKKLMHLVRVRFSAKLMAFKFQNVTFIGIFQGPGRDVQCTQRISYFCKTWESLLSLLAKIEGSIYKIWKSDVL